MPNHDLELQRQDNAFTGGWTHIVVLACRLPGPICRGHRRACCLRSKSNKSHQAAHVRLLGQAKRGAVARLVGPAVVVDETPCALSPTAGICCVLQSLLMRTAATVCAWRLHAEAEPREKEAACVH